GRVYTEIVPNCSGSTLQAIIEHIVSVNAEINSDGWRGYDGLVDVGYDKHYRVNHGNNEWSDQNGHHINGIENFWSYTKRLVTHYAIIYIRRYLSILGRLRDGGFRF